ncbi:MAG: hypothetical protein M1840_003723 [Geoglossum simile]|nr:MAG: hypothetical protein M1840_003723 [Geoglossum simile]
MPRGGFTNPAPKTESAREARKSFFCELCQKGYSRMNEFEAHESSYDHQHKKVGFILLFVKLVRLKEMKKMQRDPLASTKARKAERRADEKSGLITIKPVKLDSQPASSSAASGGFKKGGFKSAFGEAKNEGDDTPPKSISIKTPGNDDPGKPVAREDEESDTEDEGYEVYDPRRPTD